MQFCQHHTVCQKGAEKKRAGRTPATRRQPQAWCLWARLVACHMHVLQFNLSRVGAASKKAASRQTAASPLLLAEQCSAGVPRPAAAVSLFTRLPRRPACCVMSCLLSPAPALLALFPKGRMPRALPKPAEMLVPAGTGTAETKTVQQRSVNSYAARTPTTLKRSKQLALC